MLNFSRENTTYTDEKQFRDLQKDGVEVTEQDIQKARENDPDTLYKIGDAYYKKKKYEKSFAWLYKAALRDHADSQVRVGEMYRLGWGISQDYKQAMDWSMEAANSGNAKGQYTIGELYHCGWGVSQDYKQAMDWYMNAANNGSVDAMNDIGMMYQYGQGVTKNIPTAIEWYTKAANQGNKYVQFNFGNIYQNEHEVKDLQKAVNCHQKAADNGHSLAKYRVEALNKQGYYAKEEKQEANAQSDNEMVQGNDMISDVNNSQNQPSTTTSTNDNSIENRMDNLEKMFQSKINIIERNNDQLQIELAALKQEKLEQYEENRLLKERLARMEAGVQDDAKNNPYYESYENDNDNDNDFNYDSECSNDEEEDSALKRELAALKQKELEHDEENRLLKEKIARMEARMQNEAHNNPNCYSSDDEDDSNNDINYDSECSEGDAVANTHQSRNHHPWFETPADPNYDSSDNEDTRNGV